MTAANVANPEVAPIFALRACSDVGTQQGQLGFAVGTADLSLAMPHASSTSFGIAPVFNLQFHSFPLLYPLLGTHQEHILFVVDSGSAVNLLPATAEVVGTFKEQTWEIPDLGSFTANTLGKVTVRLKDSHDIFFDYTITGPISKSNNLVLVSPKDVGMDLLEKFYILSHKEWILPISKN